MTRVRRNNILIMSIGGALILAVVGLVLLPLQQQITAKRDALLQERIAGESARRKLENIQATQREFDELRSTASELNAYLLTESTVLPFIATLERQAAEASVAQDIASLEPPSTGTRESTLQVEARGTFTQLTSYLQKFEKIPYLFRIDRLTFTKGTPPIMNLQLSVTLRWL